MSSLEPDPRAEGADGPSAGSLSLDRVIEQVASAIRPGQDLGLLSVAVLPREGSSYEEVCPDLEQVQHEMARFLTDYAVEAMRRTDLVMEPIVSGQTAVVVLGPPRQSRALSDDDVRLVQDRLRHALGAHLLGCLPSSTMDAVGVYVGAALLQEIPDVDPRCLVERSLENSLTEAMNQRSNENPLQRRFIGQVLKDRSVNAVYQPLVEFDSRRVIGYEALSRPPSGPFATPDRMFRSARRNGILWSLERACREKALSSAPEMSADQMLFLNVERESFYDPELLGVDFLERLHRSGLAPSRVVLEVTEHSYTRDFVGFRRLLGQYRKRGFRVAMDDVGAGYSGLQAIAELEPDFIKVDMNLIRDVHLRPVKRELIATVRRFTENVGTVLVAEGVEKPEELVSLSEIGVNCAQGNLFARPGDPPTRPDWNSLAPLLVAATEVSPDPAAKLLP